ncbi:hypothetical protein [Nostoc sp. T09]|uniref:hypothetical protein n=1 Tax=Nostoc sp. T09 TaxID=1932621 RepID=UPI0015C51137|nr:hypothetical protein [Nostoc sp. T09]
MSWAKGDRIITAPSYSSQVNPQNSKETVPNKVKGAQEPRKSAEIRNTQYQTDS